MISVEIERTQTLGQIPRAGGRVNTGGYAIKRACSAQNCHTGVVRVADVGPGARIDEALTIRAHRSRLTRAVVGAGDGRVTRRE